MTCYCRFYYPAAVVAARVVAAAVVTASVVAAAVVAPAFVAAVDSILSLIKVSRSSSRLCNALKYSVEQVMESEY